MNINKIKLIMLFGMLSSFLVACSNDDDANPIPPSNPDFSGTFVQEDQMARPAVNTVFCLISEQRCI